MPKEKFMYTLYARPGSGSAAVEALLAEIGVGFDLHDVLRLSDGSVPETFLKINPRGEVPALKLVDDSIMTESAAMMIYLADLYPEADLAPVASSPQRAAYLRWMLYFASAVYMADLRLYYPARYSTDAGHASAIRAKAVEHMERDFALFAKAFGAGPFILGEKFSAVDIYVAMLVSWAPDVAVVFARHPNLKSHYNAVAARAKIAAVWKRNNMPASG
jgi:glutathione S-transferase